MDPVPVEEVSAGAVIVRDTSDGWSYLLLRHPAGHWDFPKGHLKNNEALREAARREIQEETGITDLRFVNGFLESISYTFTKRGKRIPKQVNFFLTITAQKDVKISDEHTDFIWLRYEEAESRMAFENGRNILRKAHAALGPLRPR